MSSTATGGLSGRRILVTGGSGFIGRHVVSVLAADGAHVRVVDLKPHPDPSVEIVVGDLGDPEVLIASLEGGIDSIVHLAAVTSVLRSLEQPELTYQTNVAATASLLEAARAAGATSLVFASTNAVTGPMQAPKISEAATLRPLTPYGSTKAAAEMLMSAYTASYGLRCTCLRLTNVYGPGMQAKDSIVARLMRAIRLGTTFEIYGDGRQVRDYVHVSDVVAAARLALLNPDWDGPLVIGTGTSLSVLDVVDAGASGQRGRVAGAPRAGESRRDAGRDRRFEPRAERRLGAALQLCRRSRRRVGGMVNRGCAVARPGPRSGSVTATHSAPSSIELELASLEPAERTAAAAFLAAHPPGLGAPLAVVIPAYNEEPTVAEVIGEIPAQAAGLQAEVIVVVDGAKDATAAQATSSGALVCDVPVNRGQGAALRLGYWLARVRGAQVIATIDADGQYEPLELARVIEPILAGRADFVSGSRRLGDELTTDGVRHAGVIAFGALISVLVRHRITDPACGLRAMRAEVTAAVTLEQPQYQASELMISAALQRIPAGRGADHDARPRNARHRDQEGWELRLRGAIRPRGHPHLAPAIATPPARGCGPRTPSARRRRTSARTESPEPRRTTR